MDTASPTTQKHNMADTEMRFFCFLTTGNTRVVITIASVLHSRGIMINGLLVSRIRDTGFQKVLVSTTGSASRLDAAEKQVAGLVDVIKVSHVPERVRSVFTNASRQQAFDTKELHDAMMCAAGFSTDVDHNRDRFLQEIWQALQDTEFPMQSTSEPVMTKICSSLA